MIKRIKLILIMLVTFSILSIGAASAATFSFYNTDHRTTVTVHLMQVDHGFKKIGPVTRAVGTVYPEDLWIVDQPYSGKIWEVVWIHGEFGRGPQHTIYFHVFDSVVYVTIMPNRVYQYDKNWQLIMR